MTINLNGTTGITTTGLTSNGIDDNATSTAMTLDTSGNLLVGKTSTGYNSGSEISYEDFIRVNRTNGSALYVGRNSSDGELVSFRKDGSTVGSIASGSSGNEFKWYGAFASGAGLGAYSNVSIRPLSNTGAAADGTVALGHSTQRFKDLYLSGGVYLGGTGSANHLDDYEEGTWTPTNSEGVSLTMSASNYQKIGNTVHLDAFINIGSNSSGGSVVFGGLPFALGSGVYSAGAFNNRSEELYVFLNSDGIQIRTSSNVTKTFVQMSALFVGFQLSYIAA